MHGNSAKGFTDSVCFWWFAETSFIHRYIQIGGRIYESNGFVFKDALQILNARGFVMRKDLARMLETNTRNIPEFKKELELAGE